MKNKFILPTICGIFLIGIFLIGIVSAVGEVSYCCEKTKDGAWCQNADEDECDVSGSLRAVPTSCEATSYCKKGCCYDSQEGTCMKNTPQKVCEELEGVWSEEAECDVPQCELGCCLIGEQAAFVTQTRCKRLSSLYSLEINFRSDIQNEIECIASATSEEKGACVFEKDYERTCLLLTQKECKNMEASVSDVSFHKGYLCTAPDLGTNCAALKETTCVEGKDGVYFTDSCGNLANIYDAERIYDKDKTYWTYIAGTNGVKVTCSDDAGNANSRTCGDCDYFLGSTCKEYKRGETANPTYGNYICRDLGCEYFGEAYAHGETWCAESQGIDKNLPGSRYFRMVCYNGEVSVEPCADFRQEVCIESDINGFKAAACRINIWQECAAQDNKEDCENKDKRDCQWVSVTSVNILSDRDNTGIIQKRENNNDGGCIPSYSPGFDFWEEETDAESVCELGNVYCTVKYGEDISGSEDIENEHCLNSAWREEYYDICRSLGDCGASVNYINKQGSTKMEFSESERD